MQTEAITPLEETPPSAQTSAPSAAPVKTPEPTSSAAPAREIGPDPFDELDKRFGLPITKETEEVSTKETKPADKANAPVPDKPALPAPPVRAEPKELRRRLEEVTTEAKTARAQVADLEKKLAAAEAKSKDAALMGERLTAKEKEHEATQAELRALKQEASPEFKEKWDQPFMRSAERAKRTIEQLTVIGDEGERPAKYDDFIELYHMPLGPASAKARELFGEDAQIVITNLIRLHDLEDERTEALKEEKARWAETEKNQQAQAALQRSQSAEQQEQFRLIQGRIFKAIEEKHPEWFKPDPADPEGNTLLEEGRKLVSLQPKTQQEALILHANIFHRAAAFSRMERRAKTLAEKLAASEATLAELKGSGPGGARRGTEPVKTGKSFQEELHEVLGS